MTQAVFLDRDGVINHNEVRDGKPYSPRTLEDFRILPCVPEAIDAFRAAGFLVIVATNQPDIATGKVDRATLDAMHAYMREKISVDDIEICFHTDVDKCDCRKPKPGLLLRAAAKHGIDLKQSWMIGDRWRDIDAGRAAGCRTVHIDHGYTGEPRPQGADFTFRSLAEAAPAVIAAAKAGS